MRILFIFCLVSFPFWAKSQNLIFNSTNEELKTYVRQALDTLKGVPTANKFRWARNRLETGYSSSTPPRGALREELDQLIIKVSDDWVNWSNQQRVEAIKQRKNAEQKAQEADSAKAYAIEQKNEAVRQEAIAKINGKKAEAGYLTQLSSNLSANNAITPALYTAFLSAQLSDGQTTPAIWRRLAEAYQDTLCQQIGLIPSVQEIRWLPDRQHFLSIKEGQFTLYQIKNWALNTLFEELDIDQNSLFFDPSGELISWVKDQELKVYNIATQDSKTLGKFTGESTLAVAISADLKWVAMASSDHNIYLYSTQTKQVQRLNGHQGKVYQIKFLTDQQSLVSRGADRKIKIWNLSKGTLVKSMEAHDYYTTDLSVSTDGTRLVSSGVDGKVKFWSSNGELMDTSQAQGTPIQQVMFMGQEDHFMTLNGKKELQFYQLKARQILGPEQAIKSISALKRGEQSAPVLAFSEDGSVLLLSANGSSRYTFAGHDAPVTSLDFTPDQSLNLSTAKDGKTLLWDLKGQVILSLDLDQSPAFNPVFAPDYQGIYYFKPGNQELVYTPIPTQIYQNMKDAFSEAEKNIIKKLIKDYQLSFVQIQD